MQTPYPVGIQNEKKNSNKNKQCHSIRTLEKQELENGGDEVRSKWRTEIFNNMEIIIYVYISVRTGEYKNANQIVFMWGCNNKPHILTLSLTRQLLKWARIHVSFVASELIHTLSDGVFVSFAGNEVHKWTQDTWALFPAY